MRSGGAFRNQSLAGALLRRCEGADPTSSLRRGRIRAGPRWSFKQLLAEAGASGVGRRCSGHRSTRAVCEAAADWANLKSRRELRRLRAHAQQLYRLSPGGAVLGQRRDDAAPSRLSLNQRALSGEWTVGRRAILLGKASGRVAYRFHARDLHLVMGPAAGAQPVRFRVLVDGQLPWPCARSRRRRPGERHSERAEVVSADPPTEAYRRSTVRDRVPRSGRGGAPRSRSAEVLLPRPRPVSARRRRRAVFSASRHSATMDPPARLSRSEPGRRVSITCRVIESSWHDGEYGRETPWNGG